MSPNTGSPAQRWRQRHPALVIGALVGLGCLPGLVLGADNLRLAAVARNETGAIVAMVGLRAAQAIALRHRLADPDGGGLAAYLTLGELAAQERPLIDADLAGGNVRGYRVALTVSPDDGMAGGGWYATAVPVWYRWTGTRTFYVDDSLTVRAADTQGAVPSQATAHAFLSLGAASDKATPAAGL